MHNRGTKFLKQLLNDKARLKKWKRMMLALSCVVVFCTVYALTIPAVTLACNMEEHTHTEECYSQDNELICGKEEHTHTEDCYEKEQQEPVVEDDVSNEPEETVQPDTQKTAKEEENVSEDEPKTVEDQTATNQPFHLTDEKISSVVISDQKNSTSNGTLKPDSKYLKITVNFKDINASELQKNYGGSFSYTLPKFFHMTDKADKPIIDSNNKEIGKIHVENGIAIITYTNDYLNNLGANTTLKGNFFVEGEVDLNKLNPNDGTTQMTTPNGTIKLDYGKDYLERFGDVRVVKAFTKENNKDYIQYSITVTAGKDGSKNVYVVDQFTENGKLVSYMGDISNKPTALETSPSGQKPYETRTTAVAGKVYLTNQPTAENEIPAEVDNISSISQPGSLVWSIDTLDPNESRTLTYFVKLSDNQRLNGQPITNKASAFTKNGETTYPKGQSPQTFTPKVSYTMPKSVIESNGKPYTKDKEGNYIIQYKLEFNLNSPSNYPLKNFVFMDYLNYSDIYTDNKMLPYISYEKDSVELHQIKDGKDETVAKSKYKVEWETDGNNYKENWTDNDGNPKRFRVTGSDSDPLTIYPGDQYYVTYKLKVKPEVYAAMQSGQVAIKNRYINNADNAKDADNGSILNKWWNQVDLNEYKWVEKKKEDKITDKDQTISMNSSDIYVKKNTGYERDASEKTFDVPKGSYKYTVNVNQTMAQFDVTNVTLKDVLSSESSDIMHYVGYAKITSYKYKSETNTYVDQETKWVKIDNQQEFELNLSQLGWKENTNGYRFEYYAQTKDLSEVGKIAVTNTFTLNGDVVKGDKTFKFRDVKSSQTIQVNGFYNLSVNKSAWHYEVPQENATSWQNGKLYWVIQVKGSAIRKGTKIQDAISKETKLTDSFLHSDSIAGIYQGKPAQDINAYASFNDFLDANKGLKDRSNLFDKDFGNSKGFSGTGNFSELTLTAKETIQLGTDEDIYIVIRTEPQSLPTEYRTTFTYKNHVLMKDATEQSYKECNSVSYALHGGGEILKELGQTFTYDGKIAKQITAGKDQNTDTIRTSLLEGNGVFASWAFKVNYAGDLKGDYRVLEDIPDGMELAYIRVKWHGSQAGSVKSKTIDGLSDDWELKNNTAMNDNNYNEETVYYYNKNKKQALIQLGEFSNKKLRDECSVDVQVVCRVTDEKVLLGGEEKDFMNQVTLQSEDGQTDLDKANSNATIKNNNLDKSHPEELNGQTIEYTITANALGQKLPLNDGNQLTLVDELGKNLELDMTTIKAKDENGADVKIEKSFNPDTRTLEISIPNGKKVIITYTVTVNVKPDTPTKVSNKVYWKSFEDKGGKNDEIIGFKYSLNAGGSTESSANPQLTIKKVDQDNSNLMNDVPFDVYECELVGDTIQRVSPEKMTHGSTVNGIYSIPSSFIISYDKIYEIKESSAPEGYIKDDSSYYIICVKQENEAYSEYAKKCIEYFESQNNKHYKIAYEPKDFNLVIYNSQKGIVVTKAFINDAAGNSHNPVSGTYTFGLYKNQEGTGVPIQTKTITYKAGETKEQSVKFINLELNQIYYVFELDDEKKPITDSSKEVSVNKLQYSVDYEVEGASTNAAKIGQTVTVTNRSRTKILPSTGGYGSLIYRLSGAMLVFASLICLTNIYKKNHLDDTSKKRRKK